MVNRRNLRIAIIAVNVLVVMTIVVLNWNAYQYRQNKSKQLETEILKITEQINANSELLNIKYDEHIVEKMNDGEEQLRKRIEEVRGDINELDIEGDLKRQYENYLDKSEEIADSYKGIASSIEQGRPSEEIVVAINQYNAKIEELDNSKSELENLINNF